MNSSKVSPKSALCLILPSEVATEIQAIRALHDKQFYRWPPHINLLYPFYSDSDNVFDECAKNVAKRFVSSQLQPITIHLDHSCFDFFNHKNSCTLLLKPNQEAKNKLKKLHKDLEDLFPDLCDKRFPEYQPHLSLGQFDSTRVKESAQQFATEWESKAITVDWNIDRVCLISRADFNDSFHVRKTILFDGTVL
uniref:2'-5' RNA ligase family protein n=1 Tax=Plectus sambesii TaxID=2011161 RepID=A0A914V288_9BILA